MRALRWFVPGTVVALLLTTAAPAQAVPVKPRPAGTPMPRRPMMPRDPIRPPVTGPAEYRLAISHTAGKAPRPPGTATPAGRTVADIDGDGIDEIITAAGPYVFVDYSRLRETHILLPDPVDNGSIGFGDALATGDFNGDGYDDLVIGNSGEATPMLSRRSIPGGNTRVDWAYGAGGIWVIPGSSAGLQISAARHLQQRTTGIPSDDTGGDRFGASLAAGDLNGDGRDDLAIGAPGEWVGAARSAGAVTVLLGSSTGITTTGAVHLHQGLAAVPGDAFQDNYFGHSLAIGQFDGDRYADLVVGVPGEHSSNFFEIGRQGSGLVVLFRGGPAGVSLSGVTSIAAWEAAVPAAGVFAPQGLGMSVAIGDATGDGLGEIASGAPATQIGDSLCGAVLVFPGRAGGLSPAGRQVITQDTPNVPDVAEADDGFGLAVEIGDVTGDGRGDLLIGGSEDVGRVTDAGSVILVPGSASGLTGVNSAYFDQNTVGGLDGAAEYETFGRGMAVLNLDGRGGLDVLIGSPGETFFSGPLGGRGAVTVFGGGSGGRMSPIGSFGKRWYTDDWLGSGFGFYLPN